MSVNASEAFCMAVCRDTFLSLWSYANPRGKDAGDELCDILVVCEPDVIIISVKDCTITDSGDRETDGRRWLKRAVGKSVAQVYGAERCLRGLSCVTKSDGSLGLPLPPQTDMRLHRVAVAFGGRGQVPLESQDFGKGFVHVLDERSFQILLRELDTISDLTSYLSAKETLYSQGSVVVAAEEADLLAVYVHRGRKFPGVHLLLVADGSWEQLVRKAEKQARHEADRVSYIWDGLIKEVGEHALTGDLEFGPSLADSERALRSMAREDRFARRILGQAFDEFLTKSTAGPLARLCRSPSGVVYVFLAMPPAVEREDRANVLQTRCVVAKNVFRDASTTIGIATEQYAGGAGHSLDVVLFSPGEWTEEDWANARQLQLDTGYFLDVEPVLRHVEEYPTG